ncbi:single-stranded DNA-binding protein [Ruminococcus sp. NK3A76]|uniref:single-stranded DNA-binding protein n=1 Tax=Ruminococcus sp. NK3A76 TaxID=877411 RepID=UPI000490B487|nr:single-stranded DNA-binding protein [Ruminococcus sp. NK3A76]
MSEFTFSTPLSDDEADQFDRRMNALFSGAAEKPERFESVGVSEYVTASAEADRTIVSSAYDTLMQLQSFQNMPHEWKEQFRERMSLDATWKYIDALKSIIEYKDEEIDKLRRELANEKNEVKVQLSTQKRFSTPITVEGIICTDVTLRQSQNGITFTRFNLYLKRNGRNDVVVCTAWKETAEYAANSFKKGDRVVIIGLIDGVRAVTMKKITDGGGLRL